MTTMQVETFEVGEVLGEHPECTDESMRLMESLGLSGQLSLVTKPESNEAAVGFPYRRMTKEEEVVYGLLCPEKREIKGYSAGTIPLRVLQVASHAAPMFHTLMIWGPEILSKDPVLVGHKAEPWRGEPFILARWGEELDAWPLMVEKAVARYRVAMRDALDDIITRATSLREAAKAATPGFMLKKNGGVPTMFGD